MVKQLEPFLPTASEIEGMDRMEFFAWVDAAYHELPRRKEERDPLNHLKKRISNIIEQDLTDEQKEEQVYEEIRRYMKLFV